MPVVTNGGSGEVPGLFHSSQHDIPLRNTFGLNKTGLVLFYTTTELKTFFDEKHRGNPHGVVYQPTPITISPEDEDIVNHISYIINILRQREDQVHMRFIALNVPGRLSQILAEKNKQMELDYFSGYYQRLIFLCYNKIPLCEIGPDGVATTSLLPFGFYPGLNNLMNFWMYLTDEIRFLGQDYTMIGILPGMEFLKNDPVQKNMCVYKNAVQSEVRILGTHHPKDIAWISDCKANTSIGKLISAHTKVLYPLKTWQIAKISPVRNLGDILRLDPSSHMQHVYYSDVSGIEVTPLAMRSGKIKVSLENANTVVLMFVRDHMKHTPTDVWKALPMIMVVVTAPNLISILYYDGDPDSMPEGGNLTKLETEVGIDGFIDLQYKMDTISFSLSSSSDTMTVSAKQLFHFKPAMDQFCGGFSMHALVCYKESVNQEIESVFVHWTEQLREMPMTTVGALQLSQQVSKGLAEEENESILSSSTSGVENTLIGSNRVIAKHRKRSMLTLSSAELKSLLQSRISPRADLTVVRGTLRSMGGDSSTHRRMAYPGVMGPPGVMAPPRGLTNHEQIVSNIQEACNASVSNPNIIVNSEELGTPSTSAIGAYLFRQSFNAEETNLKKLDKTFVVQGCYPVNGIHGIIIGVVNALVSQTGESAPTMTGIALIPVTIMHVNCSKTFVILMSMSTQTCIKIGELTHQTAVPAVLSFRFEGADGIVSLIGNGNGREYPLPLQGDYPNVVLPDFLQLLCESPISSRYAMGDFILGGQNERQGVPGSVLYGDRCPMRLQVMANGGRTLISDRASYADGRAETISSHAKVISTSSHHWSTTLVTS